MLIPFIQLFKTGSFTRNSSFLLLGNIYRSAVSFLITILLARYLTIEKFGSFFYLVASVELFSFIADFGISTIFIREAVKSNKNDLSHFFSEAFIAQLIFGMVAFVLIYFFKIAFLSSVNNYIVLFLSISVLINVQVKLVNALFRAFERMEFEALVTFIERTITILGIGFVLINKGDIIWVAFSMALGAMFSFLLSLVIVYNRFIEFEFKKIRIKKLISFTTMAVPLAVAMFFSILKDRAMIIILQWTSGNQAVGLFTAAFRLVSPFLMIPLIIGNVLLPIFSRLLIEDESKLVKVYQLLMKYAFSIGFLSLLVTIVSGEYIINIIYGGKYSGSVLVLQILSIIILSQFGYHIISNLLIAQKQMKVILTAWIIAGFISLLLSYFFSIKFHEVGIAVAYSIVELFLITIIYFELKKSLSGANIKNLLFNDIKSGAAFILVYFVLLKINFFLALSFSVFTYLVFQKLLNKFTIRDFYFLEFTINQTK